MHSHAVVYWANRIAAAQCIQIIFTQCTHRTLEWRKCVWCACLKISDYHTQKNCVGKGWRHLKRSEEYDQTDFSCQDGYSWSYNQSLQPLARGKEENLSVNKTSNVSSVQPNCFLTPGLNYLGGDFPVPARCRTKTKRFFNPCSLVEIQQQLRFQRKLYWFD